MLLSLHVAVTVISGLCYDSLTEVKMQRTEVEFVNVWTLELKYDGIVWEEGKIEMVKPDELDEDEIVIGWKTSVKILYV